MRSLVLSFGSIGRRHYEILKGLSGISEVHVVSSQKIEGSKIYKTIREAFSENDYGYIVIASPTGNHFSDLKEVSEIARNSIVLVEKPLFREFQENSFLGNQKIFVGYNLRFHPVVVRLKEIMKSPVLYANFYVGQHLPSWRPDRDYRLGYSSKSEEGGGVLLDLSHEMDLLHYLFGEIRSFSSLITHRSDLEINSEDIAIVQGYTEKNTVFSISMDYISKALIRRIYVHTNSETIIADLVSSTLQITDIHGNAENIFVPKEERNYTYRQMHISVMENQFQNLCTFQEGLKINYWIDKIKAESLKNQAVS